MSRYFMQSHVGCVRACSAVTCHLHFWQNDRDLLRATAVTRGWNGYRNKSQHRKLTLERDFCFVLFFIPPLCQDSNPRPFCHESGALTTELSPLFGFRPSKLASVRTVGRHLTPGLFDQESGALPLSCPRSHCF